MRYSGIFALPSKRMPRSTPSAAPLSHYAFTMPHSAARRRGLVYVNYKHMQTSVNVLYARLPSVSCKAHSTGETQDYGQAQTPSYIDAVTQRGYGTYRKCMLSAVSHWQDPHGYLSCWGISPLIHQTTLLDVHMYIGDRDTAAICAPWK